MFIQSAFDRAQTDKWSGNHQGESSQRCNTVVRADTNHGINVLLVCSVPLWLTLCASRLPLNFPFSESLMEVD
jgi:hypothetical protein